MAIKWKNDCYISMSRSYLCPWEITGNAVAMVRERSWVKLPHRSGSAGFVSCATSVCTGMLGSHVCPLITIYKNAQLLKVTVSTAVSQGWLILKAEPWTKTPLQGVIWRESRKSAVK